MRTVGALIFPGFELLDLFGPMEMFGMMSDDFHLTLVADSVGPVKSGQGLSAHADVAMADRFSFDIIFVPGGPGSRHVITDETLLEWLRVGADQSEFVMSVCTGSAILAAAGLLEGMRATTNKAAYEWSTSQGRTVQWQPKARWVEDGRFFTSSGVSAGIDMALAFIARLHGQAQAEQVAEWAEYDWHQDADWDPFAALHGLA